MKKLIKRTTLITMLTTLAVFFTGCSSLDVVSQDSVSSFDKVLSAIPDSVTADEAIGGWSLSAPDNSVRFLWSQDYSQSPSFDIMLEVDAEPFLNAGLDPEKLPDNYIFSDNKLIVGTKLGDDKLVYKDAATPIASYEQIVTNYGKSVGYHTAMDHYNVSLGDGNMFEWAKDMDTSSVTKETQDKDIVFVLNPEPLIAAGVAPEQVEGWSYATVSVEINGKATDVYKFLKPFDLQ
ncbi:hypothetical protein [Konateibacter massiliensis]|uniref:hypothetical protein n=1 Tax=Konateibacter massiliensis TaxID=2002841 RepID=UPI001F433F84|nr:hypothetical protein [Konateibacter massiliensis]